MFWIHEVGRKKLLQGEELDVKDPKIAHLRREDWGSEDHMLCCFGGIHRKGNTSVR